MIEDNRGACYKCQHANIYKKWNGRIWQSHFYCLKLKKRVDIMPIRCNDGELLKEGRSND